MSNLYNLYKTKIRKKLFLKFSYKNIHEIPKLIKIIISFGLGLRATQYTNYLTNLINETIMMVGQSPKITRAKKAISNFKIRQKMPIGLVVTLRKKRMYAFLEKLIHIALPNIRNFRFISSNSFDFFGNISLGIKDNTIFPELQENFSDIKRGFNITIVTTATTKNESLFLLQELGLPII